MNLIVSRAAAADIERLRLFLADKNASIAQRAVSVIIDAVHSLESFPDRGRPSGISGMRELVVPFGDSSYVLRYMHRAETGEIVILRGNRGRPAFTPAGPCSGRPCPPWRKT